MNQLVSKIKEKRELSDLPDSLVKEALKDYLKKRNIDIPKKEKQQKIIVKEVRAELRKYTGRFQIKSPFEKRKKLLEEYKIIELLKTHTSTKERLDDYDKIKELIYSSNPKSILDLGCGLNPIAIAKNGVKYYAYDIKESELRLIELYFKKNKIQGKTFFEDIREIEEFPKTDMCLIFKTLDIIESKGHKKAMEILQKIPSKKIIVSFSTKTLSGKPMNSPRRQWFENLLNALNYKFEIFKIKNEIFYIIEKK